MKKKHMTLEPTQINRLIKRINYEKSFVAFLLSMYKLNSFVMTIHNIYYGF